MLCAGELAVAAIRQARARVNALDAWVQEVDPLLDQFKYTPWDEIPEAVKPRVQAEWRSVYTKAVAKKAIAIGAPVSSMACNAEDPSCDKLTEGDAGVLYWTLVTEAVEAMVTAALEEQKGTQDISIAASSELAIWAELSRQLEREQATKSTVRLFWAMLPQSTALPKIKWPAEPIPPRECAGVLTRRVPPVRAAMTQIVPGRKRRSSPNTAMQQPDRALLRGQFLATANWSGSHDVSIESDWDGDGQLERATLGKDSRNGIRLTLTNGEERYRLAGDIRGLDDAGEFSAQHRAQLAAVDMTRDGVPDLVLAIDDGAGKSYLNAWYFDRHAWSEGKRGAQVNAVRYMGGVEGQSEFVIIPGGVINVPFGGQGRYFSATWNGTALVESE